MKIQKSTLNKGRVQFDENLKRAAELKKQVVALSHELNSSKSQVSNFDELKAEIIRLERELTQERAKIKGLTEVSLHC